MRDLMLVVHIVAAATWLGTNMAQMVAARRLTAPGGATAAAWMSTTVAFGRYLYMPAGILLLLTGVGMVIDSEAYDFADSFVSIGFGVLIVGIVLGIVVFARRGIESAQAFAEGDDAAGRNALTKLIPFAVLDTALVVFATVAMVGRWGA